jgi:hypothetical protein
LDGDVSHGIEVSTAIAVVAAKSRTNAVQAKAEPPRVDALCTVQRRVHTALCRKLQVMTIQKGKLDRTVGK